MTNQELSKIFSSVDCHPLPFPLGTNNFDKLQNLDQVPINQLDSKFQVNIIIIIIIITNWLCLCLFIFHRLGRNLRPKEQNLLQIREKEIPR